MSACVRQGVGRDPGLSGALRQGGGLRDTWTWTELNLFVGVQPFDGSATSSCGVPSPVPLTSRDGGAADVGVIVNYVPWHVSCRVLLFLNPVPSI